MEKQIYNIAQNKSLLKLEFMNWDKLILLKNELQFKKL